MSGLTALKLVQAKPDNIADVIASLQVIRSAVDAGELDRRIDAVIAQVKSGLAKQAAPGARSTLKLPSKSV